MPPLQIQTGDRVGLSSFLPACHQGNVPQLPLHPCENPDGCPLHGLRCLCSLRASHHLHGCKGWELSQNKASGVKSILLFAVLPQKVVNPMFSYWSKEAEEKAFLTCHFACHNHILTFFFPYPQRNPYNTQMKGKFREGRKCQGVFHCPEDKCQSPSGTFRTSSHCILFKGKAICQQTNHWTDSETSENKKPIQTCRWVSSQQLATENKQIPSTKPGIWVQPFFTEVKTGKGIMQNDLQRGTFKSINLTMERWTWTKPGSIPCLHKPVTE